MASSEIPRSARARQGGVGPFAAFEHGAATDPAVGTPLSTIDSETLLEPPGFLMLNYGRGTPAASLVAHMSYGALVGGLAALGQ
jgi:hypothetical protein